MYYVPETAEADETALKGMRTDQPESQKVSLDVLSFRFVSLAFASVRLSELTPLSALPSPTLASTPLTPFHHLSLRRRIPARPLHLCPKLRTGRNRSRPREGNRTRAHHLRGRRRRQAWRGGREEEEREGSVLPRVHFKDHDQEEEDQGASCLLFCFVGAVSSRSLRFADLDPLLSSFPPLTPLIFPFWPPSPPSFSLLFSQKNSPPSNPVWDEINLFLETPTEDVLAIRHDEAKVVDDPSWEPPKEDEDEAEQGEGQEHEQESENENESGGEGRGGQGGMQVDS